MTRRLLVFLCFATVALASARSASAQTDEKLFRTEVGYLNVYLSRQSNRLVHVLSINFFLSFKGKKHAS